MNAESTPPHRPLARPAGVDAVIFDMDGVITDTASVHAAAWKQLFDEYLAARSRRTGEPFEPFDIEADYRPHVDGKPRYDGVRDFLRSRGIELPEGDPRDPPEAETICGLGNRKNRAFLQRLEAEGAKAFQPAVDLVLALREAGLHVAIISASRNMAAVLEAAGLEGLFHVRVDGVVAAELGLPGKPDPAVFEEAASRLGVEPARAAVIEDAIAGVQAGRAGGFGIVVGVDRTGQADALRDAGADVVVSSLDGLWRPGAGLPMGSDGRGQRRGDGRASIDALPSVPDDLGRAFVDRRPVVFLDYDGTLTPIVDDPAKARLPGATRAAIERLAARTPVAIVSGRDLDDVCSLVAIEGIWYAGSHGLELRDPDGRRIEQAEDYLPALESAESACREALREVPEARVERKRFAIAVHDRRVPDEERERVADAVEAVAADHPRLRVTGGKRIHELRPDIDWDKGRALLWLIDELGLDDEQHLPIYLGDDVTDEDAFEVLAERGLGFVVRGEDDARQTWADFALADPDEVCWLL
ncbi:MAG: trehalose-phosphatase, partial [Candidatus Limnocylindrales bacterium]